MPQIKDENPKNSIIFTIKLSRKMMNPYLNLPDGHPVRVYLEENMLMRGLIASISSINIVENFEEFEENGLYELIDNAQMLMVIEDYRQRVKNGFDLSIKSFLYHENIEISTLVVGLMDTKYELSHNWKEHYEGRIPTREELYKEEVLSTLHYLKLRKIKRLMMENLRDLEKSQSPEEQLTLLQTHQHLEQMKVELAKTYGTVIFK